MSETTTLEQVFGEVETIQHLPPAVINDMKINDREDRRTLKSLMGEIDLSDSNSIIMFGSKAQQKMTDVSDRILEDVRNKDTGGVSDTLSDAVLKLKELDVTGINPNKKKGFFARLFGLKTPIEKFLMKYGDVRGQIDEITVRLEKHEDVLLEDIEKLDKLYDANLDYFHELELYIDAGEEKIKELDKKNIPALVKKVSDEDNVLIANELQDLRSARDDLERRVHDLKLTRQVTMQSLPGIRLVQQNDKALVNKIKSTVVNTVPLWKNQLAQSVAIHNSQKAGKSLEAAQDFTNDLLRKNAENLQEANAQIRRQVERGVFDIDTVKEANDRLIATINESLQIADEGKANRRDAEKVMQKAEAELKRTLASAAAVQSAVNETAAQG